MLFQSMIYLAHNFGDLDPCVRSKGISRSAKPYRRSAPSWLNKVSPTQVVEQITKFAKKGMTPSQIGVMLRDSHGIAQVKSVTGSKILRILKSQGKQIQDPSCLFIDKAAQACPRRFPRIFIA